MQRESPTGDESSWRVCQVANNAGITFQVKRRPGIPALTPGNVNVQTGDTEAFFPELHRYPLLPLIAFPASHATPLPE